MRSGARAIVLTLLAVHGSAAGARAQEAAEPLRDAGGHHLYLAPTGRTHPEGTRTAGVFAYLFPYAGVSVTDDLHLSGGMPLFSLWSREIVIYLTPKLRVLHTDEVDVAVGTLSWLATSIGRGSSGLEVEPGVLYATATYEREPLALTGGVLTGIGELEGPPVIFGGIEATLVEPDGADDDGIKLMAEAFGLTDDDYFFEVPAGALTLRFHDTRTAFDVGAALFGELIPFPLVGVSLVF